MTVPALLLVLAVFAGPAHATTGTTTPDCAEHGHDADHNKHCDESTTTTTTGPETTTTTFLIELPSLPTTTTTSSPATSTTTMGVAAVPPPAAATPTTTTTPTAVLSRPETLPTTGVPIVLFTAAGLLCLLAAVAALTLRRRIEHE